MRQGFFLVVVARFAGVDHSTYRETWRSRAGAASWIVPYGVEHRVNTRIAQWTGERHEGNPPRGAVEPVHPSDVYDLGTARRRTGLAA